MLSQAMLPDDIISIKKQLYVLCKAYAQQRIQQIEAQIKDIQEAINNETKSSAGDKYETARETMQQEIDMNQSRAGEFNAMLLTLEKINPNVITEAIMPGSLVVTDRGIYYIAISAGSIPLNGANYLAISATSPIGSKMTGMKPGNTFELNGRHYTILSVG